MTKPGNRDEYRALLAEGFAGILEEKGLEWKKDWQGAVCRAPQNAVTKACYRGSNAFWLSVVSAAKGYDDPRWVTMVQIMDADGKYHPGRQWHLRKGSKAAFVEYWMPFDREEGKTVTWERRRSDILNGRPESVYSMVPRYTGVFNACDVEGMPEMEKTPGAEIEADRLVTLLSGNMGVPIYTDGGDSAYYSPVTDEIHLPEPGAFESEYAFNAAALHELSHSTGHRTRLDRLQSCAFGTEQYAYEELVAEMCSCFTGIALASQASPGNIRNHRAYVQNWITAIRSRPETLMRAIRDAQNAADYLDYMAGAVSREEYDRRRQSAREIPGKSREFER